MPLTDSIYVDRLRKLRVKDIVIEDGSDTKLKMLVKDRMLDLGEEGYGIMLTGGDDIVIRTKDDIFFQIGGGTRLLVQWSATTIYNHFLPYADNALNCGDDTRRWALVRAVTVTTGDIGFEEKECALCGKRFEPGDFMVLMVKEVREKEVRAIPVHLKCALDRVR